jgi:hypothetical protein
MYTIELEDKELRLVRHAVRSYLDGFGHDEADLLRAAKALLARLPDPAVSTPAG